MYICLTIFFATFLALFTASLFQDKQTSKQRNFRANQKKKHFQVTWRKLRMNWLGNLGMAITAASTAWSVLETCHRA